MILLHPVIVHFVIALLAVGVVSDFLFLLTHKDKFWQLGNFLLILGTLCAIVAVWSGYHAQNSLEQSQQLQNLIKNHKLSGEITMWSFITLTILRVIFTRLKLLDKPVRWIYYAVSLTAIIFLFRTGFLGGEMVYKHGVGIKKGQKPPAFKPSFEDDSNP